jgi:inward rectifier potassium channel
VPRPEPSRSRLKAERRGRIGDFRPRKVGIPRYDIRDPYYTAVTAPWGAFLAAVLTLLILVNLLFALLYVARAGAVSNMPPGSFASAFFFSLETLSTVGYGEMAPVSFYGHMVSALEIVVSLGFTTSLTGILFVRLSRPRARILFAERPTFALEGDHRVLAIRIANGRQMLLTSARATLAAIILDQDGQGDPVWRTHRLELEQDCISLFPLTWTVRHHATDASPLQALAPVDEAGARVKLYLMVAAHDPAINADVHIVREYDAAAIAFEGRYLEAVSHDADGRLLVDLSRLGEIG